MRTASLATALMCLAMAADAPKTADPNEELKKFEGVWTLVSGEQEGKELPAETLKASKLTIMGDKHTVVVGETRIVGTHKVDPSKMPCQIDAADTEGPFKGKTVLGIYKLKGDTLTVCFAEPGKERPTEFSTMKGTGYLLHVWKKSKG